MLDKKAVCCNFERAVDSYDTAAVLQAEVARRLGQRLDYIKCQPNYAIDIGSGTGYLSKDLLNRYPEANVIALDFAYNMARKSEQQGDNQRKPYAVCADAEELPIKAQSIDLVVSNLMLHWSNDPGKVLAGFHFMLAPNGLLLFTTFGPDTLTEIRESWKEVDNTPHTNDFFDMHEIGDALLSAGFIDPVTDREVITMTYANIRQLLLDLKQIGSSNTHRERNKGLTGKDKFSRFEKAYEQFRTDDGLYPSTWEVIYGHAWVGEGVKLDNFETYIPIQPVG